jgi:hypothetical protein
VSQALWSTFIDWRIVTAGLLTLCAVSCTPQPARELNLGRGLAISPAPLSEGGGARAWEGCLKGHYRHAYRMSSGVNAGAAYLCCVPIDELLRDSFSCGGIISGGIGISMYTFGSEADQKVRFCSLLVNKPPERGRADAPETKDFQYIPACIPSPVRAPV